VSTVASVWPDPRRSRVIRQDLVVARGESVLAVVDGLDATDNRLEHIYNAAPSQDLLVILQNHRTIAALGPLLA
jgi:hypothetical protein